MSRSYPVAFLSCCIHVSYQSCLPGQEVGPSLSQVVKMAKGCDKQDLYAGIVYLICLSVE